MWITVAPRLLPTQLVYDLKVVSGAIVHLQADNAQLALESIQTMWHSTTIRAPRCVLAIHWPHF